jgi:hypothetical protein
MESGEKDFEAVRMEETLSRSGGVANLSARRESRPKLGSAGWAAARRRLRGNDSARFSGRDRRGSLFALILSVVCGLTPPASLAGQDAGWTFREGALVRIQVPVEQADWIVGRVDAVTADSLVLFEAGARRGVSWGEVTRAEWSHGQRREAGLSRGLVLGAVVGGVLGSGVVLARHQPDPQQMDPMYRRIQAGFAVGALGGGVTGGLVGWLRAPHQWVPRPPPS